MKISFFIICIGVFLNAVSAQAPWKLKRDFNLAFQDNYDDYKLVKEDKVGKTYYVGYKKDDTLIKLFTFETISANQVKEGWFSRFDSTNARSFNIFFKNGDAKRLTYLDTDSFDISYFIDSNLLNGLHYIYYNKGHLKEVGYYKNNARIGEWKFFNIQGKLISQGSYFGDYNRLLYVTKGNKLITLNKFLDTIKVEKLNRKKYDSLANILELGKKLVFPIHLHFQQGEWKYYDEAGNLIRREFYEKGKLVNSKK